MKTSSRCLAAVLAAALALSTPLFAQKAGRPVKKELPLAVHDVFVRAYPHATIKTWIPETKNGKPAYEIESTDGGRIRHVIYGEDGTLIEVDDILAPSEIPDAVRKAVSARYPQSKILHAEKHTAGATFTYSLQVRKKNRKHIEVTLDASCTIVK